MSNEQNIELVQKAINGSKEAWGSLYELYSDYIYNLAYSKCRNEADAADICQDVFLQGFRKISTLREPSAFAGWLRMATSRAVINKATRSKLTSNCEDCTFAEIADRDENQVADNDNNELRRKVDLLRDTDAEVINEFYFGEARTIESLMKKFDIPKGTAKRRLFIARERLRKILVAA